MVDFATELTMISSNKIRTNANHRLKIKSTQLLKYGVVYGANAAGKTNLVEFFRFFKECVSNGIPMESVGMFCKNREENKERESSFEVQITVDEKFYAYGFSVVLSKRKITAEWLYELYQNGSARCLFERERNKRPVLDEAISLTSTEKNKFEICYHTACGGTNDDESLDSIFPYRLNGCILIFRDASILQSTL